MDASDDTLKSGTTQAAADSKAGSSTTVRLDDGRAGVLGAWWATRERLDRQR
ncbi:hypothetical protein ACWD0Z_20280 [Streptomyces sp. NPDC003007]